jgi:phospho-N-acetylmuramoyl-pentapeptide-transferase
MSAGAIVALAALLGLLASGVFVQLAIRRSWGKAVRDDGPGGHLVKAGTPTMGGAAFLAVALLVALLVGPRTADLLALAGLVVASGALGLFDDLLSLRRSRAALLPFDHETEASERIEASTGLFARYRLFGQGVVSLVFAGYAVGAGVVVSGSIPVDVLFLAFVVVGSINAFNFTDGLDGLASGLTGIVLLLFLGSPLAAALLGALLGFLWYNAHPARVFMGGVGSEGLGAAVAGLAILSGGVWWLLVFALLPVLAVLSVIAQVLYFRATGGKRLLKMAPLHHHLELSGWPETRIVTRYWIVTAVLVAFVWHLTGGLW